MTSKDIWIPIKGYEGYYEVSNTGKIRSLDRVDSMKRFRKGVELKPRLGTCKYLEVGLRVNGKRKTVRVHRVVAEAFIPNPDNKSQVNHIKPDKYDNSVSNLEWATPKENTNHSINIGQVVLEGESNPMNKLTSEEVMVIFKSSDTQRNLAYKYNVTQSAISNIKTGRSWKSVTGEDPWD